MAGGPRATISARCPLPAALNEWSRIKMEGRTATVGVRQLLAVVYAFAIWEDGERRLVTEEGVQASTQAMLVPQLHAVAKRSRVDQGPGLLVFDNYKDARQAAQTLGTIATHVALYEVASATAVGEDGWAGQSGTYYRPVPGGVAQVVKG